jgi:hypothetical protein
MLTPDYLEHAPDGILKVHSRLETEVITEISKNVKTVFESKGDATTEIKRKQQRRILLLLLFLDKQVRTSLFTLFSSAMGENLKNDKRNTRSKLFKWPTISQSPHINAIISNGRKETISELGKLNVKLPFIAETTLLTAISEAKLMGLSGRISYIEAISKTVKKLAQEGIKVQRTRDGRQEKLDVVVRRTILTGLNKTAGEVSLAAAQSMGYRYVETTAHAGARNKGDGYENHESWQGKVFRISY